MATDENTNQSLEQLPLVKALHYERLSQMFWALQIFLLVATVQRMALGRVTAALALATTAALLFLSLWLLRQQRYQLAATWMLGLMMGLCYYFMWLSDGLRDEAVLGYPAILVIASIIGNRKIFIGLLVVMVVSLLVLGSFNSLGWYETRQVESNINVAILLVLILLITAYCIRLLINDIRRLMTQLNEENQRRRDSQAQVEALVNHDGLTGLPNRILAAEQFDLMLRHSQRQGQSVALLFIDLDNFKPINDSLGHSAGDEYLIQIARRLVDEVRTSDAVSRFGGDEFVVLMPDLPPDESIIGRADEVLQTLREPMLLQGHELSTTASIGIAIAPADGTDFATLLGKADMAMYESKRAGRDGIRYYNTSMNNDAQAQVKLISDLRKALQADEFSLHYQPKIDLKSGDLCGCEALLRWQHPTRGNIPPEEFIGLAERSGLIVEIGMWVVQQATAALSRFDAQGLPELTMAVNVSSLQFRRGNLDRVVEQALTESAIAPHRLEIEITESMLMEPGEDIDHTFHRLQALGVTFSIDDFGTGYSNLGYLNKMKIGTLKIDRSFVSQLQLSPQDTAIVTAIIQMANSLNLTTVAEGAETQAEAELLAKLGCTQGQGYYWAKPMPEEAFITFAQARQ
ncbi:putative bifunctional diguanylate cyclase/phosphodiesterase [Saccharospirillum impatiens]|uniref:putative bifunctional diguanylate cyclase/phosphodiesterase n=1 Tax=Saccharospirillum impatiens TaxID=169438 RepID=UPI000405F6DA|nr:EAL domain-containing protein [Saccharospirillum impatiens]